jgi:hypothetical protein
MAKTKKEIEDEAAQKLAETANEAGKGPELPDSIKNDIAEAEEKKPEAKIAAKMSERPAVSEEEAAARVEEIGEEGKEIQRAINEGKERLKLLSREQSLLEKAITPMSDSERFAENRAHMKKSQKAAQKKLMEQLEELGDHKVDTNALRLILNKGKSKLDQVLGVKAKGQDKRPQR